MNEDFIKNLDKLERIINLSIDIDEEQKEEWINMIKSFKSSTPFDLSILANQITAIDINAYNTIFQKKVNKLSKKDIVAYSTLILNYIQEKNIENTLAFLENFNAHIHKVKPSYVKRVQKLKEKKGLLHVRQRSLSLSKERILNNSSLNEVEIEKFMTR